jgi:phage internal scaffolding protein
MSKIRSIYANRDDDQITGIVFDEPTRTQQQYADECDINKLVERAIQTGDFEAFEPNDGFFIDCSEIGDYADALNYINEVDNEFRELPAAVRAKFDNNASKYADFVIDPANYDECRKLGILQGASEQQRPVAAGDVQPAAAPEAKQKGGVETDSSRSNVQTPMAEGGTVST